MALANRDEGFCSELFVGDVVDLNEGQGFSVVTEKPDHAADNNLLYGQGFFGRALFCANTPLLTATAPIWVIDGRGGKRFMGNVELSIVEERVSGGSVSYSNKASNTTDDSDVDGTVNSEDAFPDDPAASVDTDGDGKPDDWNDGKSAADSTSDPALVLDDDDDNDGISDYLDEFPLVASTDPLDRLIDPNGDYDGDGVPNASDHFPQDASESLDLDFDGLGNNVDDDDDGDGVLDENDAFRFKPLRDG